MNHRKDYWIQEIKKTREIIGLGQQNFRSIKKDEISKKIQNWDNEEWKRELASKKSVEM